VDKCNHSYSIVVDSRPNEFGTRRRRECSHCGHRWTTIELTLDEIELRSPTADPWAHYRKQVVRRWLEQQLEGVDGRGITVL
jgi:transcriptional repressor NrdR